MLCYSLAILAQALLRDTVSKVSILVVTISLAFFLFLFFLLLNLFLVATFLGVYLLVTCFAVKQYYFCFLSRVAGHLFCLEAIRDHLRFSLIFLVCFGGSNPDKTVSFCAVGVLSRKPYFGVLYVHRLRA